MVGSMAERSPERRVVTALFIDVVGSSTLTVDLGPERAKRMLDRAFREFSAIIAREGGTVEKYAGDAIHALFGAPTAHADDPQRALRAAHACLEGAAARPDGEVGFAVRVGIETGEAIVDLVATDQERQQMSVGTCVNVAARLQQLAEPGQALVGPTCREAAGDAAEFDSLGEVDLRGLGRVRAFRLTAPIAARGGSRLPFVGREGDLGLLALAYRRMQTGRGVLALVTGPPGQGKTQLVEEFVSRLGSEVRLLVARCRPPGEAGAASPLRELVLTGAATGGPEGPTPGAWAAVAHSAGIDASDELGRLPLAERQDEVVSGWRRYLAGLASARPLVVWVEDVHWADAEVVRILDRASAGVEARILVVATARPEFADRGGLRPGGDRFFIALDGLDGDAALALAHEAGSAEDSVIERAEGHPLFVIELARSRSTNAERGLPVTLQSVIGARLDELPVPDRELLQRAAVAGEQITAPAAALLSGRDTAEVAAALERLADLLYLQATPGGYRFHHGLVRDVAYGRLSVAERMRLHARYARDGLPPDDVEGRAHHLWEALGPPDAAWVWEGSPELAELRGLAWEAHRAAGRRHADRFATEAAIGAYRRALRFAAGPPERALVQHAAGAVLAADGRGDAAWAHYLEALDFYRQASTPPPELYADLAELAVWTPGMFQEAPDPATVDRLVDEGEARARQAGAAPALARVLMTRALRRGGTAPVEETLRLCDAAADPRPFAPVLLLLAALQVRSGEFTGASRTFGRIDRLIAAGVRVDQADEYRTLLTLHTGSPALAEECAARFLASNASRGPHLRTHAHREHAHVLLARGDWRRLLGLADEVERIVQNSPGTAFCYAVTTARAFAAVALTLLGRRSDAEAWLHRAEERLTAVFFRHEEVVLLAYGALGRRQEAGGLIGAIRERAEPIPHFLWRTHAVVLTMLEQWDDLDEPLAALEPAAAGGSAYLRALATAIREERDAARGGPSPGHATLRALGFAGWSALLRYRPGVA
jgi:class 3 adenylate cyclase/tetratricopeptide (TPR) repeat protein